MLSWLRDVAMIAFSAILLSDDSFCSDDCICCCGSGRKEKKIQDLRETVRESAAVRVFAAATTEAEQQLQQQL